MNLTTPVEPVGNEPLYVRLTSCPVCLKPVKLYTNYHLANGRELGQELKEDKAKIKELARLECKCEIKITEV